MDSLQKILAAVEELRLRPLNLTSEASRQILHHNPVRSSEESKNVLDKVTLIVRELLPVLHILAEVNLLRSPEDRHMLLVLRPEILVLNGEDDEPIRILLEERLREQRRILRRAHHNRSRESKRLQILHLPRRGLSCLLSRGVQWSLGLLRGSLGPGPRPGLLNGGSRVCDRVVIRLCIVRETYSSRIHLRRGERRIGGRERKIHFR